MNKVVRIIGRVFMMSFVTIYIVVAYVLYVPYAFFRALADLEEFGDFVRDTTTLLLTPLKIFFKMRSKSREEKL
nr:MAG TPA: acetylcholine receptor protein [Caudoviricetes sp.]